MNKGMEIMVQSLIKMLGLDPAKMMATVEDIRKSLSNAAADMATIRRQNSAIMAHLGVADITESNDDGQQQFELEGQVGRGDGPEGNSGDAPARARAR